MKLMVFVLIVLALFASKLPILENARTPAAVVFPSAETGPMQAGQ